MGAAPSDSTLSSSKKPARAKHACRECNSRRVRCNVIETQPCDNCSTSGAKCEVLPSRRGRYPRKCRQSLTASSANGRRVGSEANAAHHLGNETSVSSPNHIGKDTAAVSASPATSQLDSSRSEIRTRSSALSSSSTPGTQFYGESNFLSLIPGRSQQSGGGGGGHPSGGGDDSGRLLWPITDTPTAQGREGENPAASMSRLSNAMMRYLQDEGALDLPQYESCLPAIQAYFTWFHPCFPILDRDEVHEKLSTMRISRLLYHGILFIGATYCDEATISAMGFQDRSEAKSLLYSRARLLFHADWEKDELTLIQSLFLISFWRGDKFDVKDVRYWLGVAITFAESSGLHRSQRSMPRDAYISKMRRRLWWSIYVRERQSAASLGLPSRIRDEDCDIEPLTSADLEPINGQPHHELSSPFLAGHAIYVIKMVELARLLGKIIDLHFVPGRPPSSPEEVQNLDACLEAWRTSLPEHMNGRGDCETSTWSCLLQLAYNHLRILIYRNEFLRASGDTPGKQIALNAACRVSRIAEDMLTNGTLRYGQMHLITSLFAALCIHAICIRRATGVSRRIAENRAQMCLLALEEIQKYWRINNNVLDLFLQYIDESIAKRLHGEASATDEGTEQTSHETQSRPPKNAGVEPISYTSEGLFEDQYFRVLSGHWDGDTSMNDLGLFLDPQLGADPTGLSFLERSL